MEKFPKGLGGDKYCCQIYVLLVCISLTGIEKILFLLLKRKKGMAGMNVIFEPPSRNEETEIEYIFF